VCVFFFFAFISFLPRMTLTLTMDIKENGHLIDMFDIYFELWS